MPARRKAIRPLESNKDREFETLLRMASRLMGPSQPLPRIKTPQGKPGKPS
jgi:hypothetical protein